MSSSNLDGRLMSAADLVRQGAVFADIGTDHGYLPVFLLRQGRIKKAVLTDINEGPLNTAKANVRAAGLGQCVDFLLTDGALGLENYGITDYAVCGMGGELISRIIADAPCMRRNGVRLILQPMTKPGALRRYLSSSGFNIIDERYSYADGKYYVCICAEYTGDKKELSLADAELGEEKYAALGTKHYIGYMNSRQRAYRRMIQGRGSAGDACEDIHMLAAEAERRIDIAGDAFYECQNDI